MPRAVRLFFHDGYYSLRSPKQTLSNLVRFRRLLHPVYNVGDQLSPVVVSGLSGRPARYAHPFLGNKLIAIGSVLASARPGDTVWGSGFKEEGHVEHVLRFKGQFQIRAVRGPETRRVLSSRGVPCPEVYGDPALLLPLVFPRDRQSRFKLGVIPHISQVEAFKRMKLPEGVVLLSPRQQWQEFVSLICDCDFIASSSLHGVIVADAYGVPAVPLVHETWLHGTPFKFNDYFRATNREPLFLDSSKALDIEQVRTSSTKQGPPRIDLEPLLRAFPFPDPSRDLLAQLRKS